MPLLVDNLFFHNKMDQLSLVIADITLMSIDFVLNATISEILATKMKDTIIGVDPNLSIE